MFSEWKDKKISVINSLVEIIGFSVCHQISIRSIDIGGIIMPVCARCCGFYSGAFIAAVILFIIFRKKESELPPKYILVILGIFFLSFVVDGIASNSGIYNTNNNLRFITGTLFGSSIITILYPVFTFQYYRNTKKERLFGTPFKFIIFLVIIIVFIIITLLRLDFLGRFYYYFTAFSILFTFYFINLTLFLLVPAFSKKSTKLMSRYLILPSVLSFALLSVELYADYMFHKIINTI